MHAAELNYLFVGMLLPNNLLTWAIQHYYKHAKRLYRAIKIALKTD